MSSKSKKKIKKLKREMVEAERLVNEYREAFFDLQRNTKSEIANYTGAIKRYHDESHVLYHKISTLVNDQKPEEYDSFSDFRKREALQTILDQVEPRSIWFGGNFEKLYSLSRYGAKPFVNIVDEYPEQVLKFC